MTQPATCPFCRDARRMQKGRKILYGRPICKKCYYAFANRRQFAYIIDYIVWIMITSVIYFILGVLIESSGVRLSPGAAMFINFTSWPLFLVFMLKDGFGGYSPGKWLNGVQVIDRTTRKPIGFPASFKRNLPILIPFAGLFIAYQLQSGNRLGDGWSNSMAIWKRYENSSIFGATGKCESCTYDLSGNVSGVCPECGTPMSRENQLYFQRQQSQLAALSSLNG